MMAEREWDVPETEGDLDDIFGPVDEPRRSSPVLPFRPRMLEPEEELPDGDDLASAQYIAAIHRVHENTSRYPRFPIPALHDLAGLIAPDEVWAIGGRQGNGKSLFYQNLMLWLVEQGVPTLYMGTEQDDHILQIKQACVKMGVRQKLILKPTPEEKRTLEYEQAQAAVQEGLKWLQSDPIRPLLKYANTRYIDRAVLQKWVAGGVRKYGIQCVIVDHIHHMEHGEGKNPVAELTSTVHLAKDLACKYHIPILLASQIKRTGGGADGIKRFTPPEAEDFGGASAIERTADVMFGLWRPLRTDLDKKELKELRENAKMGGTPEDRVYQENVMGVRLLKDRLGDAPGKQCYLSVEKSVLGAMAEKDLHATQTEGIRRRNPV